MPASSTTEHDCTASRLAAPFILAFSLVGSVALGEGFADEAELHFRIGVERFQDGDFPGALEAPW